MLCPTDYYYKPLWWILGCFDHGDLKEFKEVNQFAEYLPDYEEDFISICEKGIVPEFTGGKGAKDENEDENGNEEAPTANTSGENYVPPVFLGSKEGTFM
eukprot:TRINITY_DN41292_c0_g1_i2.p2 TRINITY_DN41292_c0_g1~~TRINITY_DN41292_c0_g1_i2.p2  ORF type:complete len:100 (+),score=19.08 TRINITY_DN41292_c0_g1_i2:344-643(+)